jgi:acetyl esterase/lipase
MTNTIGANETALLKTDDLGRVSTPAARRAHLLDEFERSGLSGAKFAALAGIKYSTFATWAQRRRRQRGPAHVPPKPTDSVQWLEAVVAEAQNPGSKNSLPMLLQLPGGARVEVSDERQAALAAVLVRALAKPC